MPNALKVNIPFKNLDGTVIEQPESDGSVSVMDLKYISVLSLLTSMKGDETKTGVEKLKMARLAEKIFTAIEDVELTSNELILLKDRVYKIGNPIVCLNFSQQIGEDDE